MIGICLGIKVSERDGVPSCCLLYKRHLRFIKTMKKKKKKKSFIVYFNNLHSIYSIELRARVFLSDLQINPQFRIDSIHRS